MPSEKADEETGLPRATIDKVIQTFFKKNYTVAKETKISLKESCQAFLNLIILQANKTCEKERKKIITNQHVYMALENYGFEDYVKMCKIAANDYEDYSKHKPSKQDKFKESGKTMEELHEDQMRLFSAARKEQEREFGIETENNSNNE